MPEAPREAAAQLEVSPCPAPVTCPGPGTTLRPGMTRAARTLAGIGAIAFAVAGCGALLGGAGVVQQGRVADRPMNELAIEPLLVIADAAGPAVPHRAWIYRTSDNLVCFELAQPGSAGSTCAPTADDIIGYSYSEPSETTGASAMGGTRNPAAARAEALLVDGRAIPVRLVRPGAFVPEDIRVFVVVVPVGAVIDQVTILDADGTVLEVLDS